MDRLQPIARPNELPPVLTPEQARAILNIGRNQMYDLLRSGAIPAVRLGRQWRVPTARLFDWLNSGGNISQTEAARPGKEGAAHSEGVRDEQGKSSRLRAL